MKLTSLIASSLVVWVVIILGVVVLLAPASEHDDGCAPTSPVGSEDAATLPPGSKVAPMQAGTYTLTSGFGFREGGEFHRGVDFAAAAGTPIYAAADGVVAESGPASGFGNWIVIDHNISGGHVMSTVYGHMFGSDLLVEAGQTVRAGQKIALVGYDGQTVPAGPAGAHLHFETWDGGRLSPTGTPTDPAIWLADAQEPTEQQRPAEPSDARAADDPVVGVAVQTDLPPLPAAKGSEAHLQRDAIRVARVLAAVFPEIERFEGWRPIDDYEYHPSGRAVDVMIPDYTSGEGKQLGDRVADYVMANAASLNVEFITWRQIYHPVNGAPSLMEDRGSDTANHMDHVHVTVIGGGHPDSTSEPAPPAAPGSAVTLDHCPEAVDDLAPGTVPAEYERWYRQAGTLCPQIRASLLAAQGRQESGFNPRASSSAGAQGIAQFLPGTASSINPADGQPYVLDADGNGMASAWDPGDAIIGQGRYMCAIAQKVDSWIAEGKVSAPNGPAELYLAAYNAGEGAVLAAGGFPSGSPDYQIQTRPYVDTILATADQYSMSLD